MSLTASEEALVRRLLDQQAAILSLAGNESTITSKLGATKVTLADLVAASSVSDTDLLLVRQGTTEKSLTPLVLANYTQAELAAAFAAVNGSSANQFSAALATLASNVPQAGQLHGRNVVVNGGCEVAQVNGTTVVIPANSQYVIDNVMSVLTAAAKYSLAQVVNGATNSLGNTHAIVATALSAYSPAAGDSFRSVFPIEGLNFARFQYGTAFARAGSLQFKARATTAGTYSGSIQNYDGTRSYPFSFVLASNVDTLVKIENIPGDTGGAWVGSTNAGAATIGFSYGAGTTYSGAANAWVSANIQAVTGQTNLVATNGATLSVSDVQFEVSAFCTQYERKLYDQVLRECRKYLFPVLLSTADQISTAADGTTAATFIVPHDLHAAPSSLFCSGTGTFTIYNVAAAGTTGAAAAGPNLVGAGLVTARIALLWNAGMPTVTVGQPLRAYLNATGYMYLGAQI